jgi:serine/threonine protein kinase/WD40 repeat protein
MSANNNPDRIRSIFNEVVDLQPTERAAALGRLCGDDNALRAEIEALLASHDAAHAGNFMTSPTAATTVRSAVITEAPGSRVGPYKLLQVIGEGGFGTVFLAEQSEPVRRRVALKIIKLGMDTKQVIARFEAERQALALMDHPHIARVLDAGATPITEHGGGRPYFVMEYVVGDAITQFAANNNLDLRARLELFAQVCSAVQHAHTKGIIHRDIKPGNVLVTMTDGKPFARVIDFGIAKATSSAAGLTDKTLFTEHRQLIGTPEYMSPEQAQGSPDIDTRTDVYALGVLLYELLAGDTPFDGKRLRSAAWDEMRRIIKEEDPPTPSARVTQRMKTGGSVNHATGCLPASASSATPSVPLPLCPSVPSDLRGELDWIVMKSLDKDRARRYETPSALAADVERHLKGEAVQAAPPSAAYRLRKFVRRNRGPVIVGTTVALAILAGTTIALIGWREASALARAKQQDQERAAAKVAATFSQIFNTDVPWHMKPQPGLWMSVATNLDRETRITRAMTPDGPAKVTSVTRDGKEEVPPLSDSLDALSYVSAMAISGFNESNKELQSSIEQLRAQTDAAETANAALMLQNNEVVKSLTQLVHTLNLADPDRNWWWYTFADGRMVTIVREGGADWNGGVRILKGHISDPEAALESPQPPIDPGFATQTLAIMIEDAAMKMYDQTETAEWSAYTANLALAQAAMDAGNWPEARERLRECPESKRGWEWEFFRLRSESVVMSLQNEQVCDAALTDNENEIVVTWYGRDVPARLVDVSGHSGPELLTSITGPSLVEQKGPSGEKLETLRWRLDFTTAEVRDPAFAHSHLLARSKSADGKRVAYIVDTRRVHVASVDAITPDVVVRPSIDEDHDVFIRSAMRSPDGSRLLTLTNLGTLELWDAKSGMGYGTVRTPTYPMFAAFDKTSTRLITFGDEAGWGSTGLSVVPLAAHAGPETYLSRDDDHLAIRIAPLGGRAADHATPTLSIDTPDGTRHIKSDGRALRFIDAASEREVAVVTMANPVVNLEMIGDGTRLIIYLADGSARIWDIRDPSDRLKDAEAKWAERVPAGAYLNTLLASATPTAELENAVINDASLTPLRRLVAAEMLQERLAEIDWAADRTLAAITKDQTDKQTVLAAAAALQPSDTLPPRAIEKVIAQANDWEYRPSEPTAEERLAEERGKTSLRDATIALSEMNDRDAVRRAWETRRRILGAGDPLTLMAAYSHAMFEGDPSFGVNHKDTARSALLTAISEYYASGAAPTWESILMDGEAAMSLRETDAQAARACLARAAAMLDRIQEHPDGERFVNTIASFGTFDLGYRNGLLEAPVEQRPDRMRAYIASQVRAIQEQSPVDQPPGM